MSTQVDNAQTVVQQIDFDVDSLFSGAPAADNVVTATDPGTGEPKKPGFFSKPTMDLSFLDPGKKEEQSSDDADGTKENKEEPTEAELKEIFDTVLDDEDKTQGGRPKLDKSGLVETMSKLIEDGLIIPFEDEKSMDDYSVKDWKELLEANFQEREKAIRQQTPQQFFDALPEELQYAAKYVADGGQDLKGLFGALAQVEQVREMNPADPYDQEFIVRQFMQAKGIPEHTIDEDIETWKDLGKLEQKAKQYKPELDQMQEQVVHQQLQRQEQMKLQQQQAADTYVGNVYEALKTADLNGIKLDKKTQAQLYTGLVQPQYPSISGKPTNLLGHLLERYQFVEPNYPLIAEALWLLSDPDSYRNTLMKQGKNAAVEQTVRQLKTEQANKIASSVADDEEQRTQKKIIRHTNIFKR
jgi:hypothetical protein